MRLKDYIQGDRRGNAANRLEREAMSDPFLQDALDGFDSVEGNHAQIIEQLERKFTLPAIVSHSKRRLILYWSAAATVLLLVGMSAFFFLEKTENNIPTIAMLQPNENEEVIPMDVIDLQPAQIDESQQEIPTVAQVSRKAPAVPLEPEILSALSSDHIVADEIDIVADEIVVVADVATDEVASNRSVKSSAKLMVRNEQKMQTNDKEVNTVPFGKKEFQAYCRQKADKSICNGQGATVKLSFFIDETGKPSKIEFERYSCEEAKQEMENLLSASPPWTRTNHKINMTVRW